MFKKFEPLITSLYFFFSLFSVFFLLFLSKNTWNNVFSRVTLLSFRKKKIFYFMMKVYFLWLFIYYCATTTISSTYLFNRKFWVSMNLCIIHEQHAFIHRHLFLFIYKFDYLWAFEVFKFSKCPSYYHLRPRPAKPRVLHIFMSSLFWIWLI